MDWFIFCSHDPTFSAFFPTGKHHFCFIRFHFIFRIWPPPQSGMALADFCSQCLIPVHFGSTSSFWSIPIVWYGVVSFSVSVFFVLGCVLPFQFQWSVESSRDYIYFYCSACFNMIPFWSLG